MTVIRNLTLGFVLLTTLTACEKDNFKPCGECDATEIVGTWRLTEFYADPGDGSGEYEPIDSDKEITFADDGRWSSNGSFCDFRVALGAPSTGTYDLNQSSFEVDNCENGILYVGFSLENGRVTINPLCFEGCGERYRKVAE